MLPQLGVSKLYTAPKTLYAEYVFYLDQNINTADA